MRTPVGPVVAEIVWHWPYWDPFTIITGAPLASSTEWTYWVRFLAGPQEGDLEMGVPESMVTGLSGTRPDN